MVHQPHESRHFGVFHALSQQFAKLIIIFNLGRSLDK